jgi:hypothetical protein
MATLPPVGAEPGALQANTIKLTKKIENTIPQNKLIFFIVFITFLLSTNSNVIITIHFCQILLQEMPKKKPKG